MRVLVIGGTGFLGGAIAEAASQEGFFVDILTRQTKQSHQPNVRYITGDRYGYLGDLEESYDVIFDTCGFEPEAFSLLFKTVDVNALKKYVFISSTSVYDDYSTPKINENIELDGATEKDFSLVRRLPFSERTSAFSFADSYGNLKRECETHLVSTLGDKAVIFRAGLLVGVGDYTDRLTWWVRRIDQGGSVICPLPKNRLIQLVDVRDAADFAVKSIRQDLAGIFNLTGVQVCFSELLEMINSMSGESAEFKWLGLKSFTDQKLSPWVDIPLIVPDEKQFDYFFDIDTTKALNAGLKLRELEDTILDILNWDRDSRDRKLKCGYSITTEQAIEKI